MNAESQFIKNVTAKEIEFSLVRRCNENLSLKRIRRIYLYKSKNIHP